MKRPRSNGTWFILQPAEPAPRPNRPSPQHRCFPQSFPSGNSILIRLSLLSSSIKNHPRKVLGEDQRHGAGVSEAVTGHLGVECEGAKRGRVAASDVHGGAPCRDGPLPLRTFSVPRRPQPRRWSPVLRSIPRLWGCHGVRRFRDRSRYKGP